MSTQLMRATLAILFACGAASLQAQSITLDFDTPGDTEGFFLQTANAPNGAITQEFIGPEGFLRVDSGVGSGVFTQTAQLGLTPEINEVVDAALTAGGGTLSFDLLIQAEDQGDLGAASFFEILIVTQDNFGNGFTQEQLGVTLPAPGEQISIPLSFNIVEGTGFDPAGADTGDGNITYNLLSTNPAFVFRNLNIGTVTDVGAPVVIFVDNLTFSAVPEPMSLGLVGSALACVAMRRRRR